MDNVLENEHFQTLQAYNMVIIFNKHLCVLMIDL